MANKFMNRFIQIDDLETFKIFYGKYYLDEKDVYTIEVEGTTATMKYLCSRFTISKVIFNEDTQTFKYELILKTPNGENNITVGKSVFTPRNIESLVQNGFIYAPDRAKDVLTLALLEEENARFVTEYTLLQQFHLR